ncbi:MAG: DUF4124 domain-containing protein [Rhodocyclaceae bacterium]|nr:DUF4124 domain-containing protein [Burkholderiales bacterium]MBZ0142153.1 DUF4124 domain-containing protein [Rhodocyclaceae bacterium]MCL4689209.1 DUF4124 domain-containing protein [Burkholderiales bacterium]
MKTLWIGVAVSLAPALADAQTTIYKHVDESGRVTYTNRPMKGAIVLDLEPLSTIPGIAPQAAGTGKAPASEKLSVTPAVAVVTPRGLPNAVASVDRDTQKGRDDVRRKILQDELAQEEKSLAEVRKSLLQEQQNPTLIAAVRVAQQATDPTPAQQAEMRAAIDRASGRIRGLQATVAEHEKNIEALKKELGALKP